VIIGRVTGEIHSTINAPCYDGKKLLVVTRITASSELGRDYLIAVDTVGAGIGETVLVLDEGTGARQVLGSADAGIRSVVVGIIDSIDVR
jgi:ethanolamine utilization protein EutN